MSPSCVPDDSYLPFLVRNARSNSKNRRKFVMSNARAMVADAYVSQPLNLLLQGFPLTVLLTQNHALHVLVKLHVPPNTILPIPSCQ
jgi:hypothetical protein